MTTRKMLTWIGSILLVVGIAIPIFVLIYNLFSSLARESIPTWTIFSVCFSIIGVLILLLVVIWERLHDRKHESHEEVDS